MTNHSLKIIYDQVFEKIRENPQIQGLERGILYKIIQIILGEEHSKDQEKTREICEPLGIHEYSRRNEDQTVVKDLFELIFIDRQGPKEAKHVIDKITNTGITNIPIIVNQFFKNEEEKMRWFVIAACVLVGVAACLQYLRYRNKRKRDYQQQKIEQPQKPDLSPPPIPAALSLVVPAKIASTIKTSNLNSDQVKNLNRKCIVLSMY